MASVSSNSSSDEMGGGPPHVIGGDESIECRRLAELPAFTEGAVPAYYENQAETVRKMLCPTGDSADDGESRSTLLCQQMQSGKTGTYLLYAVTMLLTDGPDDEKLVDNVVILSAFSDNNLKVQIENDLEELVGRLDFTERKQAQILQQIKVFHLGDLPRNGRKRENAIGNNTLVIHDECHVGQSEKQTIEACFGEAGIEKVFLGDCSQLAEKNMWYLAVSATPFSELVANEKYQQQKTIVMGETSDAYTGVGKLIERGHVEYYDVRERTEFLRVKIDQHSRGDPGWIIIRAANRLSPARNSAYEDTIAAAAGLPIKEHNCRVSEAKRREWYTPEDLAAGADNTEPGAVPTSNFLKKPPLSGKTTVVIIAGAFRMGANLPKEYIKAVVDTTAKSACDTILQGILGRACGHWKPGPEFRVYLSASTRGSVENYARSFSQLDEACAPKRMLYGNAMNAKGGAIKPGNSFTTDTGVVYIQSGDGKAYRSFPPIKIEKSLWDDHYDSVTQNSELSAINNIITSCEGNAFQKNRNYHAKTNHEERVCGMEWDSHAVLQRIRNSRLTPKNHDLSCRTYEGVSAKLAIASKEGENFLHDKTNFITTQSSEHIGDISLLLFHDRDSGVIYLTGAYRMVADWADVTKKQAWRQSVAERANYHPTKLTEEVPIADSGGQQAPIGEEQLRDMPSFMRYAKQAFLSSLISRDGHGLSPRMGPVTIDPVRWAVGISQTEFENLLTEAALEPPPAPYRVDGCRYFRLTRSEGKTLKFEKKFSVDDKVRKVNTDVGETGVVTRVFADTGKVQVTRNIAGRKWNKQSETNFQIVESRLWAYKSISWDRTPE